MTSKPGHGNARPRVPTGVPGLDGILCGGIPRGSAVFVTGLPGSGKTVLCEQALFANAQRMESVLYVTTLSEPSVKMLQFSQGFSFFRPELIERTIRYCDLGDVIQADGPAGVLKELERLIRAHRPEFLVLDSFKVFREHFNDVKAFRRFASEVMLLFSAWEITALLVGEYSFDQINTDPEFAIADGILHLSGTEEAHRQKRYLNVVKMRGSDAFFGRHSYEISDDGMTVYPRMIPAVQADYVLSDERIPSAVEGLNEMMGGGLIAGSVGLISGGTGTGKTIVALSFCVPAAQAGTPALYVTFEEASNQLVRNASLIGWPVDDLVKQGSLHFLHVSPSELDIDRHAVVVRDKAAEVGAKVVVIDSITALTVNENGKQSSGEHLWALADHFKRLGVTFIMTSEGYSFFEAGAPPNDQRKSYLADAIILLRFVEDGDDMRRMVSVLKMRGSAHDAGLRELRISGDGVRAGPH